VLEEQENSKKSVRNAKRTCPLSNYPEVASIEIRRVVSKVVALLPLPAPASSKMKKALILFVLLGNVPVFAQAGPSVSGDVFYIKKEYQLSRLEYERALLSPRTSEEEEILRAKSGLSLMRLGEYEKSVTVLQGRSFPVLYLRLFASLKSGFIERALMDQGRIQENRDFPESSRSFARLIGGTIYLEEGNYKGARDYFKTLAMETEEESIKSTCASVLSSMNAYETIPRKSMYLAGFLSAVLPGSGQFYAGHTADAMTTFFFNSIFIGASATLNILETRTGGGHAASGIFSIIALFFYITNISGAISAAKQYNNFQERHFQQEIREKFFNLDYLEKTSGLSFAVRY